ncbi:MAG: hypothetical protein AAFW75_10830 [Cyanobacteria bacterium J06636_16]
MTTGKNLDLAVQQLCDIHGLPSVGASLARIYGRTQSMQAVLGYLNPTAADSMQSLLEPSSSNSKPRKISQSVASSVIRKY